MIRNRTVGFVVHCRRKKNSTVAAAIMR